MERASRRDGPTATGTVALLLKGLTRVRGQATGTVALILIGLAQVGGRPTDGLLAPVVVSLLNLPWPKVGDSPHAMLDEMLGEIALAEKADGSTWALCTPNVEEEHASGDFNH